MSLVKYSNNRYPSRYNRFYNDDLFDDLFNWSNRQATNNNNSSPAVNIQESEEGFTLEMATPGMQKEALKIEVNNDILTISSENKEEQKEEHNNYSRREFYHSSFSRSFTLPKTVDSNAIKAQYENGILSISIPKKEEAKPKPKMEIAIS